MLNIHSQVQAYLLLLSIEVSKKLEKMGFRKTTISMIVIFRAFTSAVRNERNLYLQRTIFNMYMKLWFSLEF
jgi:hypothetical protein